MFFNVLCCLRAVANYQDVDGDLRLFIVDKDRLHVAFFLARYGVAGDVTVKTNLYILLCLKLLKKCLT